MRDEHEMKNSGIEWIGKIPIHWSYKKINKVQVGDYVLSCSPEGIVQPKKVLNVFDNISVYIGKNQINGFIIFDNNNIIFVENNIIFFEFFKITLSNIF